MIWLLTVISLIGVVLNIQKNPWCFVLWIGTNATWACIDFYHGLPEQGAMFVIYFLLAIYGLIKWVRG